MDPVALFMLAVIFTIDFGSGDAVREQISRRRRRRIWPGASN